MARFTVLPAHLHRSMAWKNGGGLTTEIAVAPSGAGLDDFEWRISMARIDVAGPFSTFHGIERILCLLDGEALLLHGLNPDPLRLTQDSAPLLFPADRAVHCAPVGGPVTDLNVMTRRGRYTHQVSRVTAGRHAIDGTDTVAILVASTPVDLTIDGAPVTLRRRDAVRIDGVAELHVMSASEPDALLAVFRPVSGE